MKKLFYIIPIAAILGYALISDAANNNISNTASGNSSGGSATSTFVTNTSSTPVPVTLTTLIAGENLTNNYLAVEQDFSYNLQQTANTTTTVKGSAGFLHALTIEPIAGATTTVINVFDSITGAGTKIASFQLQQPATALYPVNMVLDVAFTTGLSISQTGATSTITASYR